MTLHPMQASPDVAATAFAFLASMDFTLEERWVTGGDSFRDGWRLSYVSPKTRLVVQYMDMQFEVQFVRGELTATYLELDRDLFGRRSGFHGDMFPPDKLERAVQTIAEDVRQNYEAILLGEDGAWLRVARLKASPSQPPRLP
jgi:hypothetical protein